MVWGFDYSRKSNYEVGGKFRQHGNVQGVDVAHILTVEEWTNCHTEWELAKDYEIPSEFTVMIMVMVHYH